MMLWSVAAPVALPGATPAWASDCWACASTAATFAPAFRSALAMIESIQSVMVEVGEPDDAVPVAGAAVPVPGAGAPGVELALGGGVGVVEAVGGVATGTALLGACVLGSDRLGPCGLG